jgi:hypothetical protein
MRVHNVASAGGHVVLMMTSLLQTIAFDRQRHLSGVTDPVRRAQPHSKLTHLSASLVIASVGFWHAVSTAAAPFNSPAGAQTIRKVSAKPSCTSCSIVLKSVAEVADHDRDAWLGDQVQFTTNSRMKLYATSPFMEPGVVRSLDERGITVARFGRAGGGPGEGRLVQSPVVGISDTAFVYDPGLGRISVWTPQHEFVRSFGTPGRLDSWIVVDSFLIASSHIPSPDRAGLPLHVLRTNDGRVLRSFGVDVPAFRFDMPDLNRRVLANASTGEFWSAERTAYVITKWRLDGRKMVELRRDVGWFRPWNGRFRAGTAPGPYVVALWEDSRGMLWVMIDVPDARWRANYDRLERVPGMDRAVRPADRHGLKDTIIEVIDPESGALVASRRFEHHMSSRSGNHPIVVCQESEHGLRYEIYVAELQRTPATTLMPPR